MAEKHKSKYKAPKDFEKSQKPKPRKDIKDYTEDDKKGGQNPRSTGDAQLNVLRKRDKEMVDTGDMYVKYNDDDRLYKDIETGDYDPKTAAKRLKKRQDTEEKETKDVIKDKIENLTREQKERLVREYVRRKIVKVLLEQPTPETTPTEEPEAPETETPAADATATPPTYATATPPADITATPDASATPPVDAAATPPTDTTTPTTPTAAATPTADIEQPEVLKSDEFGSSELGNIKRLSKLSKFLKVLSNPDDPSEERDFYRLLRKFSNKKISLLTPKRQSNNND